MANLHISCAYLNRRDLVDLLLVILQHRRQLLVEGVDQVLQRARVGRLAVLQLEPGHGRRGRRPLVRAPAGGGRPTLRRLSHLGLQPVLSHAANVLNRIIQQFISE